MIRAVIICPDQGLSSRLRQALAEFRHVGIARVLDQYPNEVKLPAFLKASVPELIFLSVESVNDATDVALRIEEQLPGTPVVAVASAGTPSSMLNLIRSGIKDVLAPPFERKSLGELIRRMENLIESRSEAPIRNAPVFAFLPSKAGVGATTIAVNTAWALSRRPDTSVLLMDLDFNSGLVAFMTSLNAEFSVTEAAEYAPDMDETIWSRVVTSAGAMDVLPAGPPRPDIRIPTSHVRRLVEFAQRNYSVVCLDLSGMMEKYSVDVLHQANQIYLVCTQELPSLHLANTKMNFLRSQELDDRVSVLVNRSGHKRPLVPMARIESVLGKKVFLDLPNDYEATTNALVHGKPVKTSSGLGMSFAKLAQSMLPGAPPSVEPKGSFFDALVRQKAAPAKPAWDGDPAIPRAARRFSI